MATLAFIHCFPPLLQMGSFVAELGGPVAMFCPLAMSKFAFFDYTLSLIRRDVLRGLKAIKSSDYPLHSRGFFLVKVSNCCPIFDPSANQFLFIQHLAVMVCFQKCMAENLWRDKMCTFVCVCAYMCCTVLNAWIYIASVYKRCCFHENKTVYSILLLVRLSP